MTRTVAVAVLFAVILIVACGDDNEDLTEPTASVVPSGSVVETQTADPTPEPTACPTAEPGPTASPEPTPAFKGSRDLAEGTDPAAPPVAAFYDLRYACHDDYDRIVFDFRDNFPGYRIEYVEPPIVQDGSGIPLEIDGAAFLNVRFSTATGHDDEGNSTYTGPREIIPGLESVAEMEIAGDFEGYVTWGIGLPEELDFRVTILEEPYRVVIDVAHP